MPYMALEKRGDKGIEVEARTREERIRWNDEHDTIELIGRIDDDRIIRVFFDINELPEDVRRKIAEEEIKKAAELLHVVRVAIEGEDEIDG